MNSEGQDSGWIKLHRQFLKWEWYDDINTKILFLHCILRANHAAKKWRGIQIERGQFYTSLETLSAETGLSAMQLRTCLGKLIMTGEVTSLGMSRGRMVTVNNYDDYQEDNKLPNRVVTSKQQGSNKVVTTNKNEKNEKNEKKKESLVSTETDELLETLWKLTPKMGRARSSKKEVAAEWKKVKSKPDREKLIKAIEAWNISEDWVRDGGKWIGGLHKWIKNEQWENLPTPKPVLKAHQL